MASRPIRHAAAAMALSAVPTLSMGQDAGNVQAGIAEAESRGGGNFIALGVATGPDFLGSDDYEPQPLVAGRYDAGFAILELRGLSLAVDGLSPLTGGAVIGGPLIEYRFGRDDVDNDTVDLLDDVDGSLEIGGFLGYRLPGVVTDRDAVTLRVEAAVDVADGHDGFIVTPSLSYSTALTQRWRTTLSVSADYAGENFNDSFFSVDAAGSAASGLDLFEADAGFNRVGVSLGVNYAFTPRWGATTIFSYGRLIGDAADSPIVDDEGSPSQFFAGIGLTYGF